MQEIRTNGTEALTDKTTMTEFKRALRDGRNMAVAMHKPGSTVTHSDGRSYTVQADGSWRRVAD